MRVSILSEELAPVTDDDASELKRKEAMTKRFLFLGFDCSHSIHILLKLTHIYVRALLRISSSFCIQQEVTSQSLFN